VGGGAEFVGAETVMGRTTACLRFYGEQLDPDEITRLLGKKPSAVHYKGDVVGSRKRILPHSSWRLEADVREPGDLPAQIEEIFSGATSDLSVWRQLARRYRTDLFCGVFLYATNEEFYVPPDALLMLGERGVQLSLDVYNDMSDTEGTGA
jgi:hypothetical protein